MRKNQKSSFFSALILLAVLVGFFSIINKFFDFKDFKEIYQNTPSSEIKTKDKDLEPTGRNFYKSEFIYDYSLDFSQNSIVIEDDLISGISNNQTSIWRLFVKNKGILGVEIPELKNKNGVSLSIIDSDGRIINFVKSFELVSEINPGLYQISIYEKEPIPKKIKIILKASSGSISLQPKTALRNLKINLDESNMRRLEEISLSAQNSENQYLPPRDRVKGEIIETGDSKISPSRISIGLSGRTKEHFSWPSSLDIKVEKGTIFWGMEDFKIYKIETRGGILDFVHNSVLADMGFLAPRQEIVNLSINNEYVGVYYLRDSRDAEYLENLRVPPGNIVGFDVDSLVNDYPFGAIFKSRIFYNPSKIPQQLADMFFDLSGEEFVSRIDKDDFSKILAYCSVFVCGHGLGIDDLRFYQNPISGRFRPIARDLAAGEELDINGDKIEILKSLLTHSSWWLFRRPYSVSPLSDLRIVREEGYNSTAFISVGFWDVHPAAILFLQANENKQVFSNWFKTFNESRVFEEKIRRRISNLENIKEFNEIPFIREQIQKNKNEYVYDFKEIIKKLIGKPKLAVRSNSEGYEIINLNPYPVTIKLSNGENLNLAGSFTLPIIIDGANFYPRNGVLNFGLEREVNRYLKEKIPSIASSIAFINKDFSDEELKLLLEKQSFSLFVNDPVQAEKHKIVKYLDRMTSDVLVPIFQEQTKNKTAIGYLLRNAESRVKPKEIFIQIDNKKIKPSFLKRVNSGQYVYDLSTANFLNRAFEIDEEIWLIIFEIPRYSSIKKYQIIAPPSFIVYDAQYNFIPTYEPAISGDYSDLENYFDIDYSARTIKPKKDLLEIKKSLVFPEGFSLLFSPGQEVYLYPKTCLLISGDVYIDGTKEKPVKFFSKNSKGGAFNINGVGAEILINNAEFNNLGWSSEMDCLGTKISGAITISRANITMNDVIIKNSKAEDALNAVNSELTASNIIVENSSGDGIDLDFSKAEIFDSSFLNNNNDHLDASGAYLKISNVVMKNSKDKGVSLGERSWAFLNQINITGSDMGVAIKDSSIASFGDCVFNGNRIAITSYIKKPQYLAGELKNNECVFKDNGQDFTDLGYFPY